MISFSPIVNAELIKTRRSGFLPATFIAFGLAPVMGGMFMLLMRRTEGLPKDGGLAAKAQAMHFSADWSSYLGLLSQAVGVGGVLIFGFVASWLFGREYTDGTAKDLLAMPTSRRSILNAKFVVYISWCLALAVANLLVALGIGSVLHIAPLLAGELVPLLVRYFGTTMLTICAGMPVAFFALKGRGYLSPLGFVALALVFAQIVAAAGFGAWFPWAVPGIFSGAGGSISLSPVSFLSVLLCGVVGYFATIEYWRRADHAK